ncbi:MAG: hypothetical protein DMF98_20750 [Acidobacteria bacterium]|nr:MAG: hypothetical protein DMF98_20750 [Acidobacteriota bacterium]
MKSLIGTSGEADIDKPMRAKLLRHRVRDLLPMSLLRSRFLQQVATMSVGALCVEVIGLATGPLNSRLYAPADHGLSNSLFVFYAIVGFVTTMRYEMAIPVVDTDQEAADLLWLSGFMILGMSLIVVAATFAGATALAARISLDPRFASYLWVLPASLCMLSVQRLLETWAVRLGKFGDLSLAGVVNRTVGAVVAIGLGALHFGVLGLILASLLSSATTIAILGRLVTRARLTCVSPAAMARAAKRHWKLGFYNTGVGVILDASTQLPVLMLAASFGSREVGWFSYGVKVVILPTLLISGAMYPVFFSRSRQALADGTLPALTTRLLGGLVGVPTFFIATLALFGPDLFAFGFGERWRQAGLYASLLTPWLLMEFLTNPLQTLPLVLDRQRGNLLWRVLLLAVRAGGIMFGARVGSDVLALAGYGAASGAILFAYFIWLLRIVGGEVTPILQRLTTEMLIAFGLVGLCRVSYAISSKNLLVAVVTIAATGMLWMYRAVQQFQLTTATQVAA